MAPCSWRTCWYSSVVARARGVVLRLIIVLTHLATALLVGRQTLRPQRTGATLAGAKRITPAVILALAVARARRLPARTAHFIPGFIQREILGLKQFRRARPLRFGRHLDRHLRARGVVTQGL